MTKRTSDARVREFSAGVDATTFVTTHTHMQFDRHAAGLRLVNPGSVGLPYERAPAAYWALLGPDVELRHTTTTSRAPIASMLATDDPRAELIAEMMRLPPAQDEVIEDAERRVFAG